MEGSKRVNRVKVPRASPTNFMKKNKISAIIGRNVRALRKQCRESQEKLGKVLGLEQSAVCRCEKGKQNLTPEQLWKVSNHYGVCVDELFEPDFAEVIPLLPVLFARGKG